MNKLRIKALHKKVDKVAKKEKNAYLLVTGITDVKSGTNVAYTSMYGNDLELINLIAQLCLTLCQTKSAKGMLKIIEVAYENALKGYFGEQKNE
ncbi:MAG TPA: hypothetical protein OIL97_06835 [Oscillospiraceae bacterium]|jgi:hypothetical protein|nr:hypothetical protein [Ruminococcus sp. 1001270H_150608_F2]HJI49227.1 hypothetical protein [Oscillospiraceae bacterium]